MLDIVSYLSSNIILEGIPISVQNRQMEDQAMSNFEVDLQRIDTQFNGESNLCWVHARAATAPDGIALITTQPLRMSGADIFYGINTLYSGDKGKSWRKPLPQKGLERFASGDTELLMCDATPGYHVASGKFIMTGTIVIYRNDEFTPHPRRSFIANSVFDNDSKQWDHVQLLKMPEGAGDPFFAASAGCTQWVELENGNILVPFYFRSRAAATEPSRISDVAVALCSFDGKKLNLIKIGESLHINEKRGLSEPSICRIGNEFYLTIRSDERGYVARSPDGLNFRDMKEWLFDDGTELGSYNTQQHWVTHRNELYLVYTRRGADNDHVSRNRAPLFIARVDIDKLHVIRSTEISVVPNRGATLGNFGCNHVGPDESWIVASEWMHTTNPNPYDWRKCMSYGSDNSIFVSKLRWRHV